VDHTGEFRLGVMDRQQDRKNRFHA
jgi:hypothetical protein